MTETPVPPPAGAEAPDAWLWPERAFEGPSAFVEQLRQLLSAAAVRGWKELVMSDRDFADWPLGERAVIQSLQEWAGSGRSLRMVAVHFDVFGRQHARFVSWRRHWDHIVQCRACAGAGAPEVPSALWTPEGVLQRIDPLRSRGLSRGDAASRVALRQQLDECYAQGRPAFAASVLGL